MFFAFNIFPIFPIFHNVFKTKRYYKAGDGLELKELVIYLSNECNLRCKHCFVNQRETQSLTLDDLEWVRKTFKPKKTILLGGEPLLYEHLETVFKMFPNIQISTNGLLIEKNLRLLRKYNVVSQLSIEGGEKETDSIRGLGVWDKVMESAKLLQRYKLEFYFRVGYHFGNLKMLDEVFDTAKKFKARVVLFPRIDLPPLSTQLQEELFEYALNMNSVVAQPHFFRYCGKEGRCGAGSERLNIFYDKRITPCNLDLDYTIGRIGDDEESIKRNIKIYLEEYKVPPVECTGCKYSSSCRGSCYVARSYLGCPLRLNHSLEDYIVTNRLDAEKVHKQVDVNTDFIKSVIVC